MLLDLFSRRVGGWAISATNDTELALAALHSAVERRRVPLVGLVQHTDRGSPYASADFRTALAAHGMTASMSRKADCWDNAVSESFFATLAPSSSTTNASRHDEPQKRSSARTSRTSTTYSGCTRTSTT